MPLFPALPIQSLRSYITLTREANSVVYNSYINYIDRREQIFNLYINKAQLKLTLERQRKIIKQVLLWSTEI